MATIWRKVEEKLSYVTSSSHVEVSSGSIKRHDNMVRDLTNQHEEFFDPFVDEPVRHFKSGLQIDEGIINGLLKSQSDGEKYLAEFIKQRIKGPNETKISMFEKICRKNVVTGLANQKKQKK